MRLSLAKIRVGAPWLFVPLFVVLARPHPTMMAIGAVLALVGLAWRGWAAGMLRKNETLATTGPYAWTRNPLYLGSAFIGLGVVVAASSWILIVAFFVFFPLVYWRTIRSEERFLAEAFPEEFTRYTEASPRFLPRFSGPAAPHESGGFALGQYMENREWEAVLGVLAAFVILWLKWWLW